MRRTMNNKKVVVFSPTCTSNNGGNRSVVMTTSNNHLHNKSFSRSSSFSSSSSSSSSSALRFLKRVGAKVAKALGFGSSSGKKKWSGKVSASSVGPGLVRSWSYAESVTDSHRAEAIEDCIEFLNSSSSSSSLRRSFSTTSCSSR